MQTIKPAKNQLFCKPTEAAKATKSGILLPDSSMDKPKTAEVINIGFGVTGFNQRDTIVYREYATTEIDLNSESYFLINENDVLGTVEEITA